MKVLTSLAVVSILAALDMGSVSADEATMAPEMKIGSSVVELRQYKIVRGRRDEMIGQFERNLIEGQEAAGMRLLGSFRDLDDPDRFTWLRGFTDMESRRKALDAFYYGPIWQANRDAVNPLMEDNDNVLLLRPAATDLAFRDGSGMESGNADGGFWTATIHYLWKDPAEGFTGFFNDEMAPELRRSGVSIHGAYVAETTPNDFPRLPVRQHEKVFVWLARAGTEAEYAAAIERLGHSEVWKRVVEPRLQDYEERAAQVLRLVPTERSRMR